MSVSNDFLEKLPDVEKLRYCYECGVCTASCPIVELLPRHYHPRSLLEKISLDLTRVLRDSELWLCAWCYRCYRRCPQGLKLPEIFLAVRKIAVEQGYLQGFKEALELIGREVPLPAVCCWVCFHPERAEVDRSIIDGALNKLIDYEIRGEEFSKPKTGGERIAIIGSGPAGLTAAQELAKRGYSVTVFESLPEPGGMPRKCIPDYRLPKSVLDAEIEHLRKLGIEIKTDTTIGKDLTVSDLLQKGYKAIFFATGAHQSRKLRIEGGELKGVVHALEFLREVNLGEKIELGERVAVIGGGNVAMDAARTALRLGAKDVSILYRRSREEMPANPWEVTEAENEGVKTQFLVAPKRILGKDKRVAALECLRMELGESDETGRRRPIPIEGSETVIELDTVILAIGETPDLSPLPKEVEVTQENTVAVDPFTLETSFTSVFAGGDVVSGPATVIEAIVAGKKAAVSIDRYLRGEDLLSGQKVEMAREVKGN